MRKMGKVCLFFIFLSLSTGISAQLVRQDSVYIFLDSLIMELPDLLILGERPVIKVEKGKLSYDLPRLVENLPVENAYEAIKELPGVVEEGGGSLSLAGDQLNIILNGKVSNMTYEQVVSLLKSIPVSRIEKVEVMYAAPARYNLRGPAINVLLISGFGVSKNIQGELYTSWQQRQREAITTRGSLLFSSGNFSTDLLYSYGHRRSKSGRDREVGHLLDEMYYNLDFSSRAIAKGGRHNVRWGTDYQLSSGSTVGWVYTGEFDDYNSETRSAGSVISDIRYDGKDEMHNMRLDYGASFGLKAIIDYTYYHSPGSQLLYSAINGEDRTLFWKDDQRINKWKFSLVRERSIGEGWNINYGSWYSTALDNSSQLYLDPETKEINPDNRVKNRKEEHTFNGYAGFDKSFGSKVTLNFSVAAELYHTQVWNEWTVYPVMNLTYLPVPGKILQLSFSCDKKYPTYWSTNSTVTYADSYTEVHGNPLLKPSYSYNGKLSYFWGGKYVLTAYYSYIPDYFTQLPYQTPDRLAEINKFFNFNYQEQMGFQAIFPFKYRKLLNSRLFLMGYYRHEKNDHFWDIPFDRSKYSFMVNMSNSFSLPVKPDIQFTLNGYYQNGMIQGIYDLSNSYSIDTSLRWATPDKKILITLRGDDLLNSGMVTTRINFLSQDSYTRFYKNTRSFLVSLTYKLGDYKEKKRDEVDKSRFGH